MQKKPIVPIFSLVNLILFLVFFIPVYVSEPGENAEAVMLIVGYIQETVIWILPPAAAVCLLYLYGAQGMRKSSVSLIYISLTNLIYTIPYYYLVGISGRLDSVESLTFSLFVSVVYCLIFYLHVYLLFLAARRVMLSNIARETVSELSPIAQKNITKEELSKLREKAIPSITDRLAEGRAFDLAAPATVALFTVSLIEFAIYLAKEIHTAVIYLTSYSGDYRMGEIVTMVFNFLLILAMLFITQLVCHYAKSFLVKDTNEEQI